MSWTVETLLVAAADEISDRVTVHGAEIRIDGRPATESEHRLIADLTMSGLLVVSTVDKVPGERCCWATPQGKRQARRWAKFCPMRTVR